MNTTEHAKTFNLRIPPDLREWLDQAARKNMRSVNAEILYRLAKEKESEESGGTAAAQQN